MPVEVELQERHSAGGKSSFKLPEGMRGTAVFNGDNDEYRTIATRHWGDTSGPTSLFCGMNPSTAEADINDLTFVKEIEFTKIIGLHDYSKVNVADYRATDPKRLLSLGMKVRSRGNLQVIRDAAAEAAIIVMASGSLHRDLAYLLRETVTALRRDGRELWCYGRTSDGSPRHTSRLAYATPLERFNG
jgi:hypothetical protein